VWWARPEDARPEHDALLSPADLDRRSRLLRPDDRRRTTVATAVARLVLAAATGLPPDRLSIDRTCPNCGGQHGKPRLTDAPDLHFSVSHSAGRVVVAVSRAAAVGVDIEQVGAWDAADLEEVAQLTLAPEERAVLVRQPAAARALTFTTYWTRKEAAVKATGAGLTAPLDELVVSSPALPPRVLRWGTPSDGLDRPLLHALQAPPGYVAALAVIGAAVRVAERDAGPLLRARSSRTARRAPGAGVPWTSGVEVVGTRAAGT
jgi:4'-phosphopantetheinyl transferase